MNDNDLIRRGDALAIFRPENSMARRMICDDIRAIPAQVQPAHVALTIKPDLSEVRSMLDSAEKQWKHLDHIAATIRVNAMRHGATDAEIEAFIKGEADFVEWLSAQVAPQPAPVAVAVKPLQWFEVELPSRGGGKHTADGYTIRKIEGLWLLDFAGEGKSKWRWVELESAQTAAQADYEARILSAVNLRPVADVQADAVAGAYAAAIGIAVEYRAVTKMDDEHDNGWRSCATFIENRLTKITPADAAAALDRIRADARKAEAYRIAEMVRGWRNDIPMTGEECADTIVAMIKETTHD